jgi:uncharacterized protein (TIRG00374 family)
MTKSLVKSIARYIFSATILAAVLYLFDANDVLASILGADLESITIAVGFALGAQFFATVRLHRLVLLQDMALSFGKIFIIGVSAVFYGMVVPGGTVASLAVRFVQLSKSASGESVAAALIVDRVISTIFLIAIGVISIAFDRSDPIWAAVVAIGTLSLAGAIWFRRQLALAWFDTWSFLSGRVSTGRATKIVVRIAGAFQKYSLASRPQVFVVFVASMLAHFCGCFMYFTLATSMELHISFLTICWIRAAMILSTMIPISVAGLGLREFAAIALLVPLGIGEAQAVGFSILVFLITPVIVGLLGGFAELFRLVAPTVMYPPGPSSGH